MKIEYICMQEKTNLSKINIFHLKFKNIVKIEYICMQEKTNLSKINIFHFKFKNIVKIEYICTIYFQVSERHTKLSSFYGYAEILHHLRMQKFCIIRPCRNSASSDECRNSASSDHAEILHLLTMQKFCKLWQHWNWITYFTHNKIFYPKWAIIIINC